MNDVLVPSVKDSLRAIQRKSCRKHAPVAMELLPSTFMWYNLMCSVPCVTQFTRSGMRTGGWRPFILCMILFGITLMERRHSSTQCRRYIYSFCELRPWPQHSRARLPQVMIICFRKQKFIVAKPHRAELHPSIQSICGVVCIKILSA